jgi:hypothetical protein
MCGPAGSGKSTVARQYEQEGMVRLSFDQEAWSRGITTMPLPEEVRRDIEQVLRARLADLVQAGSDVVLDFSFWSRRMRDDYREFLRPFGVVPETVYERGNASARALHDPCAGTRPVVGSQRCTRCRVAAVSYTRGQIIDLAGTPGL